MEAYKDQIEVMLKVSKQMDEIIDKDSGQTDHQDPFHSQDFEEFRNLDFGFAPTSPETFSSKDICENDLYTNNDVCFT